MIVYLIRHTIPNIEKNICYGQSDIDVADSFEEEALPIKKYLEKHLNYKDVLYYSSPSLRCTKLAEFLFSKIDGTNLDKIHIDKRLLEMNFGDWELKNWNDIPQQILSEWMNDFVKKKAPNGESFLDLYNRTTDFMKELIDINIEKDNIIVIITHGGVIRCVMSEILGFPLNNAFRLEIGFGSISKIKINRLENKNYVFSIRNINYRC